MNSLSWGPKWFTENSTSNFVRSCPRQFSKKKLFWKRDFHLLFLEQVWHHLQPLTSMYNYFVSLQWHLILLEQLQHWAVMSQYSCDYSVVLRKGEHNNKVNLFPPGQHLCLLSMTLCPHFHIHKLGEVLKNILKLDNKSLLKIGE